MTYKPNSLSHSQAQLGYPHCTVRRFALCRTLCCAVLCCAVCLEGLRMRVEISNCAQATDSTWSVSFFVPFNHVS